MSPKTFLAVVLTVCFYSAKPNASDLLVEHVSNAGVKISSGDQTVLIDALFGPHSRFNFLNAMQFSELSEQGADVALVTHYHSDHFGEKRVLEFLEKNPDSLFIAPPQVLSFLEGKTSSKLSEEPYLTNYESRHYSHNNIDVEVLHFPHMSPEHNADTQNYAYIVTIDGWKVLHIGDGGITAAVIDGLNLADKKIDFALLHDLCVEQEDCVARIKQMGIKKVAFVHMTDDRAEPVNEWIRTNYPEGHILVTGYEKVVLRRP